MKLVIRLVAVLMLVAVLLFCVFGFLATFEPLARSVQVTWRIVYAGAGALALAGIVRLLRRAPATPGSTEEKKQGTS